MTEVRSHRVFFALWPDDEAVSHLFALAHDLVARGGGRVMRPASLHLTLTFVGSVTPVQLVQLEQIAGAVHAYAFDLSLDCLGFWLRRGILWAGCRQSPPPLKRLTGSLVTRLTDAGFAIDPRFASTQVPHITLARGARCLSLPRLGAPIRWRVSEFALVETHLHSSAASYKTLAGFPLSAADAG
jgi:2'-5' RNA ligase